MRPVRTSGPRRAARAARSAAAAAGPAPWAFLPALLAGALAADLEAAPRAQSGPQVTLTTIAGAELQGNVTVAADGALRLVQQDGSAVEMQLADVLAFGRPVAAEAPATGPTFVWLRSGSVLPARRIDGRPAADGRAARLLIDTPAGARLDLPLTAVAALRCRKHEPQTFAADRAEPALNDDYLYIVKDGEPQRFSVQVVSIHGGAVHFDLRGTAYEYSIEDENGTAAIVFGRNTGFAPDPQPRPRVLATMTTGERIEGRLLQLDTTLRMRLDEGAEFTVPSERLLGVEVESDKLEWLSRFEPEVQQTGAFDRAWPWTVDRSPAGPGIVLGGRTYSRGLVLVPRTRLAYDLGGRFDALEAVIGIDDRGGPQAHAIFRVLGDGRVLFESEPMTRGQPPRPIRVGIGNCDVVAIEADFGKNFDLGDLCAFAEARVTRN